MFIHALLAFAVQLAVVLGLITAGCSGCSGASRFTTAGKLAAGISAYAIAGWLSFWLYFAHHHIGEVFSVATMITAAWGLCRVPRHRDLIPIFLLIAAAGVFYIAMLLLYPADTFSGAAANRFIRRMPGDNIIPRIFAERLSIGMSPKAIGGDWLSSDRPPLQSGLVLLAWPLLRWLRVDMDVAFATAGVAFQLLWIPAMWSLLRLLGLNGARALAATCLLVFTGFIAFSSVFVWPKLGAAALVLLAFCQLRGAGHVAAARRRPDWMLAGALLGLGNFAHGGVMFSIVALLAMAAWCVRKLDVGWLWAAAAFLVLAIPWSAYQRFYEPPGNRLLKWHIAGVIPPDARSFPQTLFESYRSIGWAKAAEARVANSQMLFRGNWDLLSVGDRPARYDRRLSESLYLLRLCSLWLLAAGAAPFVLWRLRINRPVRRQHAATAGWLLTTAAVWVTLMFTPNSAVVHQGSYVVPLLLLGLLAAWAMFAGEVVFVAVASLQVASFFIMWTEPATPPATPQFLPAATATFAAAVLITTAATALWWDRR